MVVAAAPAEPFLVEAPAAGEVSDAMRLALITKYRGAEGAREWMVNHPLPSPNACVRITPERAIGHQLG